jgi:hypothetical protein
MYCTASLNPDLPNGEGKVHPAAAAGTTMHSMYEYGLGEGKFRPWTDAEIERLWAGRFDPKSAYRIAKWGIQATLRLIKQYELKQFLLEQTVYPGIKDNAFWGTADFIGLNDNTIVVADFKTGSRRYPVSPVRNEQLASYLLGALELFPDNSFDTLVVAVSQPQVSQNKPLTWVVEKHRLETFSDLVAKAIGGVTRGEFRYSPSVKRCQFCPKVTCEERIKC